MVGSLGFELLVNRLRSNHHEDWASEGYPFGWFWKPAEAPLFRGIFSRMLISRRLLTNTPRWANNDPKAQLYIHLYRLGFFGSWGVLFGFFVTALLLS